MRLDNHELQLWHSVITLVGLSEVKVIPIFFFFLEVYNISEVVGNEADCYSALLEIQVNCEADDILAWVFIRPERATESDAMCLINVQAGLIVRKCT